MDKFYWRLTQTFLLDGGQLLPKLESFDAFSEGVLEFFIGVDG